MSDRSVTQLVPTEQVERLIHLARGEKVLLDADLARLYGVTTGNLNKAVRRNQQRFPPDFTFQLSDEEAAGLIFQSGRSKHRGGRRHNPYAFTEQGVAMLSSVLRSERAAKSVSTPLAKRLKMAPRRKPNGSESGMVSDAAFTYHVLLSPSAKDTRRV